MKFVKRITALFLAMVMVMAMGITASADTTQTYTIKTQTDDTHTYSVYQIFTGTLSSDGVLGQIVAGTDYNTSKGDAAEAAKTIAGLQVTGQELANAIAEYANLTTEYGKVSASQSLTNVPAGYYLIKDNGPLTGNESYSTYVVEVVKDVTINPKKGTVTFEKKVKDTNDTTGATTGWQDSADYDIGDAVPFQLKGTIPANYDSYTVYKYKFTDQMEPSLTLNADSIVVKVDGVTTPLVKGQDYTVTTGKVSSSDKYNGGDTFTINFADLKKVTSVTAGATILVEYNATLNENAVLGNEGNVNEAKLTYSNNPNKSGNGDTENEGETPWDAVIVFTYKVDVNKVDQDNQPREGAGFTLYKKDTQGKWNKVGEEVMATKEGAATDYTASFKGLDDGDYKLVETTVPAGYNKAADVEFTITAEHKVEWASGDRTTILTELKGGSLGTGDVATGTITTTVKNQKGSTLPSTGGMGTTVLYVAGIALIVVAGVVVIARKRNA